jgi:hypothetical protein
MTDDHAINHHHHVTVHDIAGLLHHLADLRSHGRSDDPAERTAFLAHKAELLTRIADQYTLSDPAYSDQVRQLATDALTAAKPASRPRQQPGPTHRRTIDRPTNPGGANSQENRGANPG